MAANFTTWLTQNFPYVQALYRSQTGQGAQGQIPGPPPPPPGVVTTTSMPSTSPQFTYSPTGPGGNVGNPQFPQAGLPPFGGGGGQIMGQSYFPQAQTAAANVLPPVSALPTAAAPPDITTRVAGDTSQGGSGMDASRLAPGLTPGGAPASEATGVNQGYTFPGGLSTIPTIGGALNAAAMKVGQFLSGIIPAGQTPAEQTAAGLAAEAATPAPGTPQALQQAQDLLNQASAALAKGDYQTAMAKAEAADRLGGGVLGTTGPTGAQTQAATNVAQTATSPSQMADYQEMMNLSAGNPPSQQAPPDITPPTDTTPPSTDFGISGQGGYQGPGGGPGDFGGYGGAGGGPSGGTTDGGTTDGGGGGQESQSGGVQNA
jgi:hypothetical protein